MSALELRALELLQTFFVSAVVGAIVAAVWVLWRDRREQQRIQRLRRERMDQIEQVERAATHRRIEREMSDWVQRSKARERPEWLE